MLVTQWLPKGFDQEKAKACHLRTAAFRDWQNKLNRNDQLPSNPLPYQPTGSFDANLLVKKS